MKILKRGQMPDGTKIQIEDWKENYSFKNVYTIGTYPLAVNTSKNSLIRAGETFRLELDGFKTNEEVEDIFTKLEKGKIELKDLSDYFLQGHTDKFYLGLVKTEEMTEDDKFNENLKIYIQELQEARDSIEKFYNSETFIPDEKYITLKEIGEKFSTRLANIMFDIGYATWTFIDSNNIEDIKDQMIDALKHDPDFLNRQGVFEQINPEEILEEIKNIKDFNNISIEPNIKEENEEEEEGEL